MKENQTISEECSGELEALLEDVLTQIQELRELLYAYRHGLIKERK